MTDKNRLRAVNSRLTEVRAGLLATHPFFGRLLLRLPLGFADCGTAFTDMRRVVFDPAFAERLGEAELRFVFLHELMHCVLHHCTRSPTLHRRLYNIACDIVVNSLILEALGVTEFNVDGSPAMHLTPEGKEGRLYTAEEVYRQLLRASPGKLEQLYGKEGGGFDKHSVWGRPEDAGEAEDTWDRYVAEAAGSSPLGTGIPYSLRRYLKELSHAPRTNWHQLLQDFIRHDRSDYDFRVPDRRFQGDFLLPSFRENIYGDRVDKLWFLIDTSASISDEALTAAYVEIRDAAEQIGNLSGELSFFDTRVSDPVPFASVEELEKCEPVGGGGTSFHAIFAFLGEHYGENLPNAVIILTDGRAAFPREEAALGLPVMWIIIGNDTQPPWGECVHIES